MIDQLLPIHFNAPVGPDDAAKVLEVSKKYSKGRVGQAKTGVFTGDSEKKERAASDRVKLAADKYLQPATDKLDAAVHLWKHAAGVADSGDSGPLAMAPPPADAPPER